MQTISQINPLWQVGSIEGILKTKADTQQTQEAKGIPVFSDVLSSMIQNTRQTDNEYREAEYLLATGQLDNPAALSIAGAKAELSAQLLAQLRNKALEAYNTVTSMTV